MDINKIKELAEVYLQEQVDLLMRFTSVDSESNYVEGNRQVIDMARAVLETIPGVTMEEMFFEGCGTHLIARIKPEHPEGKIILNSHMDTVFPVGYAAKFPPYVDEDNWLHGLGSGDCKAGFAVSAYAVKIASELGLLPNKEIVMLYSCDEEIGSITSRKVFEKEAPGTECAYIFESAAKTDKGYGVVSQRKGVILGALDIKGVEAHAGGAYMAGHSAVKELAHKILKLYSFNDYDREIYYNVAPISGGRPNGIVAGDAHMEFCVAGLPDNGPSFAEAEANIESLAAPTKILYVKQLFHTVFCSLPLRRTKWATKLSRLLKKQVSSSVLPWKKLPNRQQQMPTGSIPSVCRPLTHSVLWNPACTQPRKRSIFQQSPRKPHFLQLCWVL